MLRTWATSFVLMLSTPAMAGSISYDFRFDMRSTDWNEDATTASTAFGDGYRFEVKTGRVDFKGKLYESLDYRLRWRFDKPQVASTSTTTGTPATNLRDNVGDWIDLAYIQHKLSDQVSITVGKFASDMGGWENQTPSPDEYLFSEAFNDTTSGSAFGSYGGSSLATKNTQYYAGAKVAGFFKGQELALHVANNQADSGAATPATTTNFNQNKGWTGLVYKGKFFDDVWSPIVSYHTAEAAGTSQSKRTYIAFGNNIKTGDLAIEADLISHAIADNASNETKINAAAVQFGYSVGNLIPKLKLATADKTVSSTALSTKAKITSGGLILEYKPKVDETFRYHVAFMMNDYIPDPTGNFGAGVGKTISNKEIVAGVRITGDFLK